MASASTLQEWLELQAVEGLGPKTFVRLLSRFGSPTGIRRASLRDLQTEGEISKNLASALHRPPPSEAQAHIKRELHAVQQGQVRIVTLADPGYPDRLKTIPDPPPVLYMKGQLLPTDDYALAIVGARKCTSAGQAWTRNLSGDLSALGFTITSGLARGIDASAHEAALNGSGRTIAVLGCGIDRVYPPEHTRLRRRIEAQGALLSEFSMGTPPHSFHFPQRNRIISGLSLGVIVTEATLRSGSLITARLALEQNREVFAVPGNITNPLSKGPHALLKQGAKLVEETKDVVEEILPMLEPCFRDRWEIQHAETSEQSLKPGLGTEEQQLFDLISLDPIALDDLISQGSFLPSEVMSILLSLEIKGLIKQVRGLQYIRTGIR